MSDSMKTKYEVQKYLIASIKNGLIAFGQTKTVSGKTVARFDCVEFGQPMMWKLDECIALNHIANKRIGWQGRTYLTSSLLYYKKSEWLEEQLWNVHVLLKRKMSNGAPTVDTITAEDVAEMLKTWFNDNGCAELRTNHISVLPIDHTDVILYNDDSSLYQKRAVIRMSLIVPKEFQYRENEALGLGVETYPV